MVIISGKRKNLAARYYSNVIDYAVYFILIAICVFTLGEKNGEGSYSLTGVKALLMPLIWFLYFPMCESTFKQTLGKRVLNLYVIDVNGESPSIIQTFLRRILDFFEIMSLGVPSLLSINASEKNQRIGDRLAATTVITTAATCRFCGTELELNAKEVVRDVFKCPTCNEIN